MSRGRASKIAGASLSFLLACVGSQDRAVPWPDLAGARSVLFVVEGYSDEAWLVNPSALGSDAALELELPEDALVGTLHALMLSCAAEPALGATRGPCAGPEGSCVRIGLAVEGAPLPPPSRWSSFDGSAWQIEADDPVAGEPIATSAALSALRVDVPRQTLCSRFSSTLVELGPEVRAKPESASALPDGSAVVVMPDGSLTRVAGTHAEKLTGSSTVSTALAVFARAMDEIYVLERNGTFWRTDLEGRQELLDSLELPAPATAAKLEGSAASEALEIFAVLATPGLAVYRDATWTWLAGPESPHTEDWAGLVRTGPREAFAHAGGLNGVGGEPTILHVTRRDGTDEMSRDQLSSGGQLVDDESPSGLAWSRALGAVAGTSAGRLFGWRSDRWVTITDFESRTRNFSITESNEGVIYGGKFKTLHEFGVWSGRCSNVHVAIDDVHELVPFAGGFLAVVRDTPGRPSTAELLLRQNARSVCGLPL